MAAIANIHDIVRRGTQSYSVNKFEISALTRIAGNMSCIKIQSKDISTQP